jgi:hypothetical protein
MSKCAYPSILAELWTPVKPRDSKHLMNTEFLYRKHISLALNPSSRAPYGQGANCWVEVVSRAPFETGIADRVLARVDHKSMGVDFDLGEEPTLSGVAAWLARELRAAGLKDLAYVGMEAGDGSRVLWTD